MLSKASNENETDIEKIQAFAIDLDNSTKTVNKIIWDKLFKYLGLVLVIFFICVFITVLIITIN